MERRMFKMYCDKVDNKFELIFKLGDEVINKRVEDCFENVLNNSSCFFSECCNGVGFDSRFDVLEVDLYYYNKNKEDVCNIERRDCNGNIIGIKRKFKLYCFEDSYYEFNLILVMNGLMVEKITTDCFENTLIYSENLLGMKLNRKYCYDERFDELEVELNYIYG